MTAEEKAKVGPGFVFLFAGSVVGLLGWFSWAVSALGARVNGVLSVWNMFAISVVLRAWLFPCLPNAER